MRRTPPTQGRLSAASFKRRGAAGARQCDPANAGRMQRVGTAGYLGHLRGAHILVPTLDGTEPEPYEQLIARFELTSVDAASNLLMTAKRMFA